VTATLSPAGTSARVEEWASATVRPGRLFAPKAERALHPVLRELASRLPGAQGGVSVIAEMPGPTGLPDLVAIPITPQLAIRLAFDCPPLLSWGDARLVSACSTFRPSSVAALSRRLGSSEENTQRRVRRLLKSGALLQSDTACVLRPRALAPVGRLYALEAKIDDWSAGFGQALRYGVWADATAVVLGQLPKDPSRVVDQASSLGIGLAHGKRWIVRPRLRRLEFAHRLWASEHVVAAISGAAPIPSQAV
jgi:hypothetical protein